MWEECGKVFRWEPRCGLNDYVQAALAVAIYPPMMICGQTLALSSLHTTEQTLNTSGRLPG